MAPISCLVTFCRKWTLKDRVEMEALLRDLLPTSRVTWVPDLRCCETMDPLSIILKSAETQPSALGVARIIMDYCVAHANRSRNLAFLAPFFHSLHRVMNNFPDEALERLGRIAFVEAPQRAYIIDNHIIVHPPTLRLRFWKSIKKPLCKTKDPILQLHFSSSTPDESNYRFPLPVFMASFDALWHNMKEKPAGCYSNPNLEMPGSKRTSRWRMIYSAVQLKGRLWTKPHVECHNFNLESFDNPAIAALVAYKWNTIGFSYWLFRFLCQCCYYVLVIVAAISQVYLVNPKNLIGVFGAIVVMAAVFVWLEIVQAMQQGWKKYTRSYYNGLDLIVFFVPMAASIDQIIVILQNDPNGNSRLLSFSIVIVFFHMLFELRVIESVCKYVTIIQQAVLKIKVFFVIFAGGILAFAAGILHLLHACPVGDCDRSNGPPFPTNFLGALFSTYFFLGGIYDPVSDQFDSEDWAFHLMMVMFLFFTVILMLNVLISLMNTAFDKIEDIWRLAWIQSRLRFIESAENMSYDIPGFRQQNNWFPEEIYFTATEQKVEAYRRRHRTKRTNKDSDKLVEDWERGSESESCVEASDKREKEKSLEVVNKLEEFPRPGIGGTRNLDSGSPDEGSGAASPEQSLTKDNELNSKNKGNGINRIEHDRNWVPGQPEGDENMIPGMRAADLSKVDVAGTIAAMHDLELRAQVEMTNLQQPLLKEHERLMREFVSQVTRHQEMMEQQQLQMKEQQDLTQMLRSQLAEQMGHADQRHERTEILLQDLLSHVRETL
ncbi:hypothetical protein BGZ80_004599 [Entomortierella chlamydospora]|uniref:Ion transport domain-containing protein n=1 Tax=Entomortierella chlamydospora TaxID=101097 RepID=A0A9P6SVT1_9FUNG|nr:hypothetical protein BGZ80_004599 [Entomortierella chlamydospora]